MHLIGSTLGHYQITAKIGEGGMGEVYAAEQLEPVVRKVALKIIKPGMDSAAVIARSRSGRGPICSSSSPCCGVPVRRSSSRSSPVASTRPRARAMPCTITAAPATIGDALEVPENSPV